MILRPGTGSDFALRGHLARILTGFLLIPALLLGAAAPAEAQLLPAGFFDMAPHPGGKAAAVEADKMAYDSTHGTITAEGSVLVSYDGYVIRADHVTYDQGTGGLVAKGHVAMRDPMGDTYQMDSIEVTGGMKEAFVNSLTLTTAAGARITASDTHYTDALVTTLTDATYSPCGLCIDSKGQKIGWKVKAATMVYDRKNAAVYMTQPSLEVLGVPVAWLPWFWVPDPTQPRATGLRMPSIGGDGRRGAALTVPYFVPLGEDADLLLSPTLLSRQGLLLRGDLEWRFGGLGEITVGASGLYQLDKSAYAGLNGDRAWRGAIQSTGRFTPTKDWTVGWSYTAFTDNGYLKDYGFTDKDTSVNEAYATHLTDDTYFDARVQQFSIVSDLLPSADQTVDPDRQASVLPDIKYRHVQDLAPGAGRVNISGELLSVTRGNDQTGTTGSVPYVYGYQGDKQHLELEAAWENQWILPGGITASPYLGGRLDAARYDRTTTAAVPAGYPAQADADLLSATPIAAMDFRWPLVASNGPDTHLLEPIAQLVYRGSSTTDVGITNEDAQSFVFDTSNLFSYNRFSGIDRQETGLRANVGAHYLGSFADGSWLDLVAGESFHLLGPNGLADPDAVQAGTSTGLGSTASYIVASANGGLSNGISGGAKLQYDPNGLQVTHFGAGLGYTGRWVSGSVSYNYTAANAALGTAVDHEAAINLHLPLTDYWSVDAGYSHNIATNSWAEVTGGVGYDDGYFSIKANAYVQPTTYGFGLHAGLKGPDGGVAF
jgi:LPS-assembly protein